MQITRKEALSLNPVFTTQLLQVQEVKYRPDGNEWEAGDQTTLDVREGTVVLSQAQADLLNQEAIDSFESNRDRSPFASDLRLLFAGSATLISPENTPDTYLQHLGETLEALRIHLGQPFLFVVGDWPTPWLTQENAYPPVQAALAFLKTQIDPTFSGGFKLKGSELTAFIPHLFWLVRGNMALPEFMIGFPEGKFVFSICKHGVLHFEFYDPEAPEQLLGFFASAGFLRIDRCADPVAF